ncbi:MAG: PH domain-containing protein [Balneolales bacterium]|nr:PH domain-containing protein [Balneolales bacterium]
MTDFDLSTPQRQSIAGILILFVDSVYTSIKAFWPFLLIFLVQFDSSKLVMAGAVLAGALTLLGILAWLVYLNFTFYFDEQRKEFVVNRGVLKKTRIAIHISKIQQVNINQSIIQSLVNVYSLDIDTAGSGTKEVSVRAINFNLAKHLKENLLEFDDGKNAKSSDENADSIDSGNGTPFLHLKPGLLFRIGITTKYGRTLALIVGFLATAYGALYDVISAFELDTDEVETAIIRSFALISVGIIIGTLLVLMFIINLARTFLRHYDFKMYLRRFSLFVSAGLLVKKNTLIRPEKVQVIVASQNYFQRKMRFLELLIQQATPIQSAAVAGLSSVEIPGCPDSERDHILKTLFGEKQSYTNYIRPNYRYLLKAMILGVVLPVGAFLSTAYFTELQWFEFWYFLLAYVAAVSIISYFRFSNSKLMIGEDFIAVQSGAWDVTQRIVKPYKLQGITIRQMAWHKRLDIGHVVLHTASGDVTFRYAPYAAVVALTNKWLYQIEGTSKHWM